MDDKNLNLSFSSLWQGLSAPVLTLAEEMALRRSAVANPSMTLRVRSGGIEFFTLSPLILSTLVPNASVSGIGSVCDSGSKT